MTALRFSDLPPELKREWFQEGPLPHYDVIGGPALTRVIDAGAIMVSRFELVRVARAATMAEGSEERG